MRSASLQTCDWAAVRRELRCSHCLSDRVRVDIEAFAEGLYELRRRRGQMIRIELALTLLRRASYSASRASVPVEAVRLALRVLHEFVGDRELLEQFWAAYEDAGTHPWSGPRGCFDDLVLRLLKRGFAVPAEFR